MRVFVLLFNARTENEGIHTIQVGDRNIVLMFVSEDDATRFGVLLEAQDFNSPTVEVFDREEIEDFCQSTDYDCKLVPEGTLAMPPETNVEVTNWQADSEKSVAPEPELSDFSNSELDRIRRQLEGLL
jgi:hypothetical protein